jgi:zinc and cadmium transporter
MPIALLAYYCALILVASIIGGLIPVWFRLTHTRMQFAVSFVAGVMLGVAVLQMLPHAIVDAAAAYSSVESSKTNNPVSGLTASSLVVVGHCMTALLLGMLTMFFIERFFSFHQHGVPVDGGQSHAPNGDKHEHHRDDHSHDLSWGGAALGLALHSVLNGVALAAAVGHDASGSWLAGLGTFLVIFLHKPFDAMTIGMLMAHGDWSLTWRHTVNALFSLAIPLGALLFYFGLMTEVGDPSGAPRLLWVAYALAFSAGTFLCISLSDLLPELQFHQHDRVKLSVALVLGLTVAWAAGRMETAVLPAHVHRGGASSAAGP